MGIMAKPASAVQLENYKFVRTLETGGLGAVHLYESAAENEEDVVIKVMKRRDVNATREEAIVRHSMLTSPHVVKLKEVVVKDNFVGVITEFCAGGSLEAFIKNSKNGRLTESRARNLFQQLIKAVEYTERKGVTNRDLKLSNTLLAVKEDGELQLKISDFCYSIHDVADANRKAQALAYVAPELMTDEACDEKLADMWQVGVMLYAMLYGKFPFVADPSRMSRACSEEIKALHTAECAGGLQLPGDVPVSEQCKNLLKGLLVGAAERLTLADVMAHEWFLQDLPEEEAHVNNGVTEEPVLSMKKRQSVADIKQLLDFALC